MIGGAVNTWSLVWSEALAAYSAGGSANVVRGFFTLPIFNYAAAFRVLIPAFTGGTITVKLRFGFEDADAQACRYGIDFDAMTGLSDSGWAVQPYRITGMALDPPVGAGAVTYSALAPIPYRAAILLTVPAHVGGTTLTYNIFASCLSVP